MRRQSSSPSSSPSSSLSRAEGASIAARRRLSLSPAPQHTTTISGNSASLLSQAPARAPATSLPSVARTNSFSSINSSTAATTTATATPPVPTPSSPVRSSPFSASVNRLVKSFNVVADHTGNFYGHITTWMFHKIFTHNLNEHLHTLGQECNIFFFIPHNSNHRSVRSGKGNILNSL